MWLTSYGTVYNEMHSHTLLINGIDLIRTCFLAMFKDWFKNDTNPTLGRHIKIQIPTIVP